MGTAVAGRDVELGRVTAWLDGVPARSGALSLVGEAGIGKTVLWRELLDRAAARGWRVLSALPAEGEAQLGYSALGDLLAEVDGELAALPDPQRQAIEVALLRARPRHPLSAQAVAVGTAALLQEVVGSGPVLLAVDDLQWLDPPSDEVLRYVLRRLPASGVGVAVTVRSEGGSLPLGLDRLDGHERVDVGPLSLGALHHLLRDHLDHVFNRPSLVRISEASRGNPLFAIELGRALLRSGQEAAPGRPLPVPESLRELIAGRLDAVSPAARRVLLTVAAAPSPTVDVIEAVVDVAALTEAEQARLVEVRSGRVLSTHPLVAEACYESASTADRRTVHAELADHARDVEERARHLALSARADGDGDVAATLHDAAVRAAERGANDSAADLARLALEHTSADDEGRGARQLLLGELLFRTGDTATATSTLEQLPAVTVDPTDRAKALCLLARIQWESGTPEAAAELVEQAFTVLGDEGPPELRAELHTTMAGVLLHDLPRSADHSEQALAILTSTADPDPRLLASAMVEAATTDFVIGRGLDESRYLAAADLERLTVPPRLAESALACLAADRKYADQIDQARSDMLALLARAEAEDESSVPYALSHLPQLELWAGDWDAAEAWAQRHAEFAERTGQTAQLRQANFSLALVVVHRGRTDTARALADEMLAEAAAEGDVWSEAGAQGLLGLVCAEEGDAPGAAQHLGRWNEIYLSIGLLEPGRRRLMGDHLEALLAIGATDEAEAQLDAFEALGRRLDRASGLGQAARVRAMLLAGAGRLDDALGAVAAGLEQYERVHLPFDRARLRLVEGRLQRRLRQKRLARAALDDALSTFTQLGAKRFAERASAELDRMDPAAGGLAELTPTERRVAGLLAEGRTVKAVAELAFMSPKTVEAHLTRVYRKLGISSRAELGARLAQDAGGDI